MELAVGDTVEITECRPLSKNKCFKVTNIKKKAIQVSSMKEDDVADAGVQGKRDHRDADYVREKNDDSSPSV